MNFSDTLDMIDMDRVGRVFAELVSEQTVEDIHALKAAIMQAGEVMFQMVCRITDADPNEVAASRSLPVVMEEDVSHARELYDAA